MFNGSVGNCIGTNTFITQTDLDITVNEHLNLQLQSPQNSM